jgi:hypothetical protein
MFLPQCQTPSYTNSNNNMKFSEPTSNCTRSLVPVMLTVCLTENHVTWTRASDKLIRRATSSRRNTSG